MREKRQRKLQAIDDLMNQAIQRDTASINKKLYTTLAFIKNNNKRDELICYSMGSPWWCLLARNPYSSATGLPLDPLGSPLFQARIDEFFTSAQSDPEFYGSHGLKAFELAYHGNVLDAQGKPTALKEWSDYNALLDLKGGA